MLDFKAKMHQIRFPLSQISLAVFKGPTSNRRKGERKERKGREGEREGRGGREG